MSYSDRNTAGSGTNGGRGQKPTLARLSELKDRVDGNGAIAQLPRATKARPETSFRREFLEFLRAIGYKLSDFLPNLDFFDDPDSVDANHVALKLPIFPKFLINRATGFDKLRGIGPFRGQLAATWEKRANLFLGDALKRNERLQLGDISFVVNDDGRPRVDRRKLVALYLAGQPFLFSVAIETGFKRDFTAFLSELEFRLRDFFPETTGEKKVAAAERWFPQCIISRAIGWERLRGQGPMNPDLANKWAERANLFIAHALEKDRSVQLHPFAFIVYEDGRPNVIPEKLIAVYQEQREVQLTMKLDASLDDTAESRILDMLRRVVGDTKIILTRAREGCTEITILVPRQDIDTIVELITREISSYLIADGEEEPSPPTLNGIERMLLLKGPPIDLARAGAGDRFGSVWRRAVRIESVIRPWRRLRSLVSPSIHSSPMARVISESNERAYSADFSDR